MVVAGYALLILGYAALYSGLSNVMTGGKGWGFMQSLIGKGGNSSMDGISTLFGGGSGQTGAPGSNTGNTAPSQANPISPGGAKNGPGNYNGVTSQ